MAKGSNAALTPQESNSRRSKSRSPARSPKPNGRSKGGPKKRTDYGSDGVEDNDILKLPSADWAALGGMTLLALVVRLFRISQPTSVVFDEVHFGGFASKYIKGAFFMDVHPPLAKLLITLAGWLAGFDGDFDFKEIGKDYLEPGVPYVAMRLLPALCGVATIPTMFLTLKAMGCRTATAVLGAGLIIFENGLLTQSRLILLDSPLVIMTALTALAFISFTNQQEQGPAKAFSPSWWFWLYATGVGLGLTASVKWVGLFTIAWVGSLTVLQLWVLLGDPKNVTPRIWFKHVFARVFGLIFIPAFIYMFMFAIHFICLSNPGEGDGFMSSEFQATLNNKGMADVPVDVVFGSRISLRHWNTQGGYLHSHPHMYPTGSQQQQITLYPHKDENNVFLLENQTQPELPGDQGHLEGPTAWDFDLPTKIKNGDVIRLYHLMSDRRLHSHDVRPPVSEADWQNEVSAYGYEGFEGDANDLFKIDIVQSHSEGDLAKEYVRTIQTKFRLVHIMTGCVLFSHKVKLPDWAYEQQEVTCAKGGSLPNSIWYIESNMHPRFDEDAPKVNYRRIGFLGKFLELQKVMWTTNAGLTDSHAWDSRPPSWPLLNRGINFWGQNNRQIYLIGNPLIWWSSTAAILVWAAVKGLAVLRWQRGYEDYKIDTFKRFDYEVGMSVLGWAFHYFPFYLMQRQLFLHHYFPALYFAIMALSQIFDFVTARFGALGLKKAPAIGSILVVAYLTASVYVFTLYAPLAYGNMWTKSKCRAAQLFPKWDWDCNNFLDSYEDYNSLPFNPPDSTGNSAQAAPINENAQVDPEAATTPKDEGAIPEGAQLVHQEEMIEYRDEDGNLIDHEQLRSLGHDVKFETKYETKLKVLQEGVAPPHPDVEGADSSTKGKSGNGPGGKGDMRTRTGNPGSVEARPASEGKERTK